MYSWVVNYVKMLKLDGRFIIDKERLGSFYIMSNTTRQVDSLIKEAFSRRKMNSFQVHVINLRNLDYLCAFYVALDKCSVASALCFLELVMFIQMMRINRSLILWASLDKILTKIIYWHILGFQEWNPSYSLKKKIKTSIKSQWKLI